MKTRKGKVITLAGAYVATIIGSGFATGQELLQFFAYYGMPGLIAIFISMFLFSFLGMEFMERGRLIKPKEPMKMFSLYMGPTPVGKVLGIFFEWFVPIFLFGVYVVMISGAGTTLSEYYGLNPYIGRVGMAVVSLIIVLLGLKRLTDVIGKIGPVIIVFTLVIGLISLVKNWDNLPNALEYIKSTDLDTAAPNPFISGILYASYNVVIVVAILAGMGADTKTKGEAVGGGILGGVSLMLAAGVMYLALISSADTVFDAKVPTLALSNEISHFVGILFSIVLLLGILSTATPLLWTCTNRFVPDDDPKFKIIVVVMAVLGLIGGFLPFDVLVGTLYPITGYIGMFIMIIMVIRMIIWKKNGVTGAEAMRAIEAAKATKSEK